MSGLILTHRDGQPVKSGDTVTDFRGDKAQVQHWREPHKEGAAGFVYVIELDGPQLVGNERQNYVTVFGLTWERPTLDELDAAFKRSQAS